MLYPDVPVVTLDQFNGAITRLDAYSVPQENQLYAQNVTFLRGEIGTRYGHSTVVTTSDGAITSMVNWLFTFLGIPNSMALYYAPSVGVKAFQQGTGIIGPFMTVSNPAAGAVMVPDGQRLYASFYDSTGRYAADAGQVYGWNIGADPLFAAPLTITPTIAETGPGLITAGVHKIGYMTTTRNGYTGQLSPIAGGAFSPVSFTASGAKNLQVTIAGALPSYLSGGVSAIQIVMSTVANPNRYFAVPGAVVSPAANPSIITFSITDDDLAATGTDVTNQVDLLATSVGGTPPFILTALFPYSSRMGYIGYDLAGFPVIYLSNQNDYQYITADQHLIAVEGRQQPVGAFSMGGVCYIGTQFSFYSTEDNGDVPSTWTPPKKVDGSIGILSPTCFTVNQSIGYALIASDRGAYIFQGGVFPALPISYYQQDDWGRINWKVPTTVQVSDDQVNKRFIVLAPLKDKVATVSGTTTITVTTEHERCLYQTGLAVIIDGVAGIHTITVTGKNTFTIPGGSGTPTVGGVIYPQTASHELTWDYTEGDTPETVKYSIDSFKSYNAGAMATMQNLSNSLQEIWYAPSASGVMIRQNDGTESKIYRDVATDGSVTPIESFGETSLIPNTADPTQTMHSYNGAHLRVTGDGALQMRAIGLDRRRTTTPVASPLALSQVPGREVLIKWWLRSEQQSIEFGTDQLDHWFTLSLIRAYYVNEFSQR